MGETKDVLGLAPYGEALKTLTQGAVDGAAAFLSRICLPAAEEFGLLLRDRVHAWRARNLTAMLAKAEKQLPPGDQAAHPRLLHIIVESASWTDDDAVQRLWAGLLVSACTTDGRDESNKIFIDILASLVSTQIRVTRSCKRIWHLGSKLPAPLT